MLNINADLARSNVDNFKNRDYQNFKRRLEQMILDESQRGNQSVIVSIPIEVDTQRLISEVTDSGFDVSGDIQEESGYTVEISWKIKEVF